MKAAMSLNKRMALHAMIEKRVKEVFGEYPEQNSIAANKREETLKKLKLHSSKVNLKREFHKKSSPKDLLLKALFKKERDKRKSVFSIGATSTRLAVRNNFEGFDFTLKNNQQKSNL